MEWTDVLILVASFVIAFIAVTWTLRLTSPGKWRVARWTKEGELFVAKEKFLTSTGAQAAAKQLNTSFAGFDGLARALSGRMFFAVHVDNIPTVKDAKVEDGGA